jgi:uncharacterized protein YcaQ
MKNSVITLIPEEARELAVKSQLFFEQNSNDPKKALLNIIERLGYVQIDTISIIERAHKHVLWTRLPEFKNEHLDELIDKKRKIFEFWDHAAAYLPMKHFRYTLPRKEMYAKKYEAWEKKNRRLLAYIIERIREEGPLQSRNFEDPKKRGLWWDWKPAKEGLEFLFHTGKLSVKARKSFQKVYDLTERVIPGGIDTTFPAETEHAEHLILKAIKANGFASEKEMFYLRYCNRQAAKQAMNKLLEEKKILPLRISGIENETYFTGKKQLKAFSENKQDYGNKVFILSPFDNMVIQRRRLSQIFNFDYVIECYVPAGKRKFGYFCLPVLYGSKFICRIDAKAERSGKLLRVINIFWEKDSAKLKSNPEFQIMLYDKLMELAFFAGCETVLMK